MDIGDEPGRVSTEEVVINDGPFARQLVFFRTNEPPGTLVIHTSRALPLSSFSATTARCATASASAARASSGRAS